MFARQVETCTDDAHSNSVCDIYKVETAARLLADEWVHRVWHRHAMVYYSTVGRDEVVYMSMLSMKLEQVCSVSEVGSKGI